MAVIASTVKEGSSNAGIIQVSRSGSFQGDLSFSFVLTGTAANGSDFAEIPLSATINGGDDTETIFITPLDDQLAEDNETVTLTLSEAFHYAMGQSRSGTVTIEDNDASSFVDPLGGADNPVAGLQNWFFSDWYGFYNTTFAPWIFHPQHSFQFVFPTQAPGQVFLFDLESHDFWWTTSAFQPLTFYSFNRKTFNFYFVGTANPRQFVDLQTEEFWTIP